MVDQLNGFAAEVTRLAREVGTEGQVGVVRHSCPVSQAPGKTSPKRQRDGKQPHEPGPGIVKSVTAVANGDLPPAPDCESKGRKKCPGGHDQQHYRTRLPSFADQSPAWPAKWALRAGWAAGALPGSGPVVEGSPANVNLLAAT